MATAKTRRFKVLAGAHAEGEQIFRKGEVVESDKDLTKLFQNKFQEVGSKGQPLEDDKDDLNAEVDTAETKIVVDGGRSGPTDASPSRSTTTRSAGPVAADWAVTERAGKGEEVEQPDEDDDDEGDEDSEEGTQATSRAAARKRRRASNASKKST